MRRIIPLSLLLALCSCAGSGSGGPDLGGTGQTLDSLPPPALGDRTYALPMSQGWATGNVGKFFDVDNNSLFISGGATGSNPANGYWNMPIPLETGQSIAAVGLTVTDSGGVPILAVISARDPLSGAVTQWCQGASDGTGVRHSVTFSCQGTVPAGVQTLWLTPQGPTATIYGVFVQPTSPIPVSIAPPALNAGNNNDYNPSGFSSASIVRLTTGSGAPFLTGLSGGTPGRTVTLFLASMGDPLVLARLDGSSAPANQLVLPIPPGQSFMQMTAIEQAVTFIYDGTAQKWRLLSRNF